VAVSVVYLFERENEQLSVETRLSTDGIYELTWRRPDGTTQRETFAGEMSLRARLYELHLQLENDHWHPLGPPELLAGGWKI
jgi:hypothetical protein